MISREAPENKLLETLAAYRCSACGKYFDGYVCGQLIEGYYKSRAAKPVANLCETCLFILRFWTSEITQAAAADGGVGGTCQQEQEEKITRRQRQQ